MTVRKASGQDPVWSSLDLTCAYSAERRFSEDTDSKGKISKILTKWNRWRRHSHEGDSRNSTCPIHPEIQALVDQEASRSGKRVLTYYPAASQQKSCDPPSSSTSDSGFTIDPAVLSVFTSGCLLYGHQILPGFYACFGDFSEVTEYGEPPSLDTLRTSAVKPGREVMVIGSVPDTFLVRLSHRRGKDPVLSVVSQVVRHIALLLGGAVPDADLLLQHRQHSMQIQQKQGHPVVSLSQLLVGTSFHRSILAKHVLGQFNIQTRLVSSESEFQKKLYFRDCHGVELSVNLTDCPGEVRAVSSPRSALQSNRSVSSTVITDSPERTRIQVVNPVFQAEASPSLQQEESESESHSVQGVARSIASDSWPFGVGGPQLRQAFPKQTLSC